MLYRFIKIITRGILLFFVRKKIKCGYNLSQLKGPAIIASNHPNSMMDAAIIGCLCSNPVHFTIRSDMFKNKVFRFLLSFLNGIPVYRSSEEKEKLKDNFTTFNACREVLKRNGIVLIFSEGVTLQDWKLKPLKSGTFRIVSHAQEDEYLKKELRVVPVGLTYSNYTQLAKTVIIQAAPPFYPVLLQQENPGMHPKQAFNDKLFSQLLPLIPGMTSEYRSNILLWQALLTNTTVTYNCHSTVQQIRQQGDSLSGTAIKPEYSIQSEPFYISRSLKFFVIDWLSLLLLAVPSLAGILLNGAYYFPIAGWCRKKTAGTIFFDSLLLGIVTITYPAYIFLLSALLHLITPVALWMWLLVIPVTGWCLIQAYVKMQSIVHYPSRKKINAYVEEKRAAEG